MPRQWLINVTYTLVGQLFATWAKDIIDARNQRLVEEQKLAIDIDPEILQYFTQSTAVSSKCFHDSHLSLLNELAFDLLNSSEGQRCLPSQDRLKTPPQAGGHLRLELGRRGG